VSIFFCSSREESWDTWGALAYNDTHVNTAGLTSCACEYCNGYDLTMCPFFCSSREESWDTWGALAYIDTHVNTAGLTSCACEYCNGYDLTMCPFFCSSREESWDTWGALAYNDTHINTAAWAACPSVMSDPDKVRNSQVLPPPPSEIAIAINVFTPCVVHTRK